MSDTAERVKKIVVEHLGVEADKVGEQASFIDDLSALDGDSGARHIISHNADRLEMLETDDAGVLFDIDTAGDLETQPPDSG